MAKLDEMIEWVKMSELLQKKEKKNVLLWILAVIGAVVVIAGIAYAVYRYLTPDYLDDIEDEFEDDFFDDDEEDYMDDEEEAEEVPEEEEAPAAEGASEV